jgi:high affinity sulfate transporter 1
MDIMAGITLAAMAIPEVMGYTKISGTPVITGLYTILIPMALFALFGSSRHLVVGADSATAAILAAGLAGLASAGSNQYVALASVLALMEAGLLILVRVIRLGFLADFLSRTVLIGFLTGVGIQVALGEIPGMLGLKGGGHDTLGRMQLVFQQIEGVNFSALAIALSALVIIVGSKRTSKKIPGTLIAVTGAIAASKVLDLPAHVHVLGSVPSGLPNIGLPEITWSWALTQKLLPTAFAMLVVILAQSSATSRAYAARYNESFNENADLTGLALANIGAGLSGTFVVNGSPTKTQVIDSAGGRSQLPLLVTMVMVLLVLLFLTAPLAYMPEAVLSAVVFLIGFDLIDIKGMHRIYRERPWEFLVALITATTVVTEGVAQGILIAMLLSLLIHTRHGYRPKNLLIIPDQVQGLRTCPVDSLAQMYPGLIIYRFNHGMYYANAELLAKQITMLVKEARPALAWFCIDAAAVDDIDFSAAETLRSLYTNLKEHGVKLVFTELSDNTKKCLDRSRITSLIGADGFFSSIAEVLDAYTQKIVDGDVTT